MDKNKKQPDTKGLERLSAEIINALRSGLDEDTLQDRNFATAMWIAMQILCAPRCAIFAVREGQLTR
ncbi:TPA: hypothetical protein JTK81_002373 [Escherichia coli]|nr:hypothetical protein [Escherichia coli]EJZ0997442.1 hypothetical protein [Escherichia coli]EKG5947933.1 hypothetical protein [Escherichia coli]EKH9295268.1 hypothetical protein [Escherichia coli]HAX8514203.1 hypothetical protein [Escherichia coli]